MDKVQEKEKQCLLELKQVCFAYDSNKGGIEALKNVNLKIFRHEFVCVLGPSGCGKSTLLGLIAGFYKETSGDIQLEGESINGIDWHRGVVFQKDNLFEWFTVRNNISYGLRMRRVGKKEINERTEEMLKKIGLSEFADRKVYELSGGMRQRASIGRTLINEPDILLMDEPFSALDAMTREQMQDFLRSLWKDTGNTIFFITHDIDEAMVMGTRLVILSKRPGTIVEDMSMGFTDMIYTNNNSRAALGNDYFKKRREIYDLISKT